MIMEENGMLNLATFLQREHDSYLMKLASWTSPIKYVLEIGVKWNWSSWKKGIIADQ
jgi:hypothetical protein